MSQEDVALQAPRPLETTDLHFKTLSKLKLFDGNNLSLKSNTSLLAVSQYYGLIFVGTSNGFLILRSKDVFSADSSEKCLQKEILLNSETSHLAVSFEQKHLAVGSHTDMGPIIYIYDIGSFLTKGVSPIKTFPLSKPFPNTKVVGLRELMWQPNNLSGLTMCCTDGSVSSLGLFQGSANYVNSLPDTTQARCLCWSPKGKQIVIGCEDGTLSQYKPDLKFIKKLPAPYFFTEPVSVVNVLWISSFQFAAAYKDYQKYREFPLIIIINTPKNEAIKFINYDDITFSTMLFRDHQLYFCHMSAWNLILLASANSIEVAVLHGKEDNSLWEQWLLGDASRAELPLDAHKAETFPIGIAIDYTSDQPIPWGEDSLPPAPRLLLLSSEGLLITFNILNMCKSNPQLTHPPKEIFDDSWFTPREMNNLSVLTKTNQPSAGTSVPETNSLVSSNPMETLEASVGFSSATNMPSMHPHLYTSLGYGSTYVPYSKEQVVFTTQQVALNQQSQSVYQQPCQTNTSVISSQNSSMKWPQNPSLLFSMNMGTSGVMENNQDSANKNGEFVNSYNTNSSSFNSSVMAPKESVNFKDAKENLGLLQEPTQGVKFNESSHAVQTSSSALTAVAQNAPLTSTANVNAEQNLTNKNLKTSPSRSTSDLVAVSSKLYVTALMDEIDHFDAELKDVLSRVSAVRVHIGTEEDKVNLRKSVEKLNDMEKKLHDTTSGQRNEIHSIKSDVIEAFAWLEDARSRNRQRKSRTYIELKKSEDLDPMSSRIMSEISHLKYYIENQLKQLHSYLMKEWMEHENNCRIDIKSLMIVPSMEELYKTMHLELKILNKLRATVEELRQRVAERNMKVRSHTALISDSVGNYSKPTDDSSRMSELYKLADNLLQIKIGRDETDGYINITDAFQLMVKNQINEIVERSKKFTSFKQNILRDTFCEREMMKTRSVKSKFGSSYFIRNSSRLNSKYMSDIKSDDVEETIKAGNKELDIEVDNATAEKLLPSTIEQEVKIIVPAKSVDENKVETREIPVSEQSNTFVPSNQERSKNIIGLGTPSLPNKSEIVNTKELSSTGQPDATATSSTVIETTKGESKTTPFVFKAAPVFSFGSTPQSQKQPAAASGIGLSTGNELAAVVSADSSNTSVFSFKAADLSSSPSTANLFTLPDVKTSSFRRSFVEVTSPSFQTKTSTPFSFPPEVPAVVLDNLIVQPSDSKTSATTSTTIPIFSFSNSNTSTSSTVTAPSSSSTSGFKFTTSAGSIFKFTTSTGSFSFSSPFNTSKTNIEVPTTTFSITSPAVSTALTNVTTSSETTTPGTDTANLSSKSNITFKGFLDTSKDVNPEKAGSGTSLSDQESVLSATVTPSTTTTTVTNVTAKTTTDISQTIVTVTTSLNTPKSEEKIESESGKSDAKENVEGSSVTTPNGIILGKSTNTSSPGKTEASSIALSGFFQQSPTQVFAGSAATSNPVGSNSCSIPAATTLSFGVTGKSIFSQPISISTSSSIFSTTGSSIFSSAKPVTTNAPLFSATPPATVSSSSIFGHSVTAATTAGASPFIQNPTTTSSTSSFAQSGKDEVGKTTALFGDMLRSGLSTGSVFETPSTNVSGNIFGKSTFDKSGSSIFGNAGTTVTPATTTAGLFDNTSSNISMKSAFSQIPSSNLSNVFGQPQRENNTFFGQSICGPFGSTTTTTPNQNPFAIPTGFNSRPVFGQSLFGQSSTGQNPLERSSTTSIFGNTSGSSPSGGNIFQMGSSSFSTSSPTSSPFSNPQSTSPATSAFQKPKAGGFGGSPVFGSGLATTATFGAPPRFPGASTFGQSTSFDGSEKIFGSPQGTFGQNQPNFKSLANESTYGFADLAQRSQSQSFGGNTFNQNTTFGEETSFRGESFSTWR